MSRNSSDRMTSALDAALDVFRMRQYFNAVVRARDIAVAVGSDVRFLDKVRRAMLPLPIDRTLPPPAHVFPRHPHPAPPALPGRVGVVATGGSGALASLVGVARALEESGTVVSVYSLCSGSSLFGFPLGVGLPAEEVAELTAALRPRDYIDIGWRELATLVPTLGRGWCGLLRGDELEAYYRRHLGELTLSQLKIPAYAPIWNVEHNRIEYVGPRTYPDLPVARAIRMAVSLPLFIQPAELNGLLWCDGGIVDIFPVHPVLDIEPPIETAVAVNGFYPHNFDGEDVTGWERRPVSIVAAASQVRTSQQVQLARENLARLRASADTLLVEPVPYRRVAGAGFYEQFVDTTDWPEFMTAGRAAMLAVLRRRAEAEARATA